MLRTTFLCSSIHCSKRISEKSSLHSSYGSLSMQHLMKVNFKQRKTLVSLPPNRCRLSTSAWSRGEELPCFLSWVTPPADVIAPQDISSQPQRGRTDSVMNLQRVCSPVLPPFNEIVSLLMSAAKLPGFCFKYVILLSTCLCKVP